MKAGLIIVGCQSGDEGKGKFTDVFSEDAYAVVRYQGGPNAGHTVVTEAGKFQFKQVPSGVLRGAVGVLGNGCVIDPGDLSEELLRLSVAGVSAQLRISETAHVILPYHREQDAAEDRWRGAELATSAASGFATGAGQLGTTNRGVGPCREDKIARIGLRMIDLVDREVLSARLGRLVPLKRQLLQSVFGCPPKSTPVEEEVEELTERHHRYGLQFEPYLCDVSEFLATARKERRFLVYEGAQSVGLDIEHGTYPYVSTGYSAAGGVTVGTGTPPGTPFRVVGVSKAYMATVGGGPLPTELHDETADYLVERGKEYGTVTGRRRRVGWLDLAFLRKAARIDGTDYLCLTNVDVLAGLPEVQVATHYLVDGEPISEYPASLRASSRVEPVLRRLEGWPDQDWDGVARRGLQGLPEAARRYAEFVADSIGVRLGAVSVGPLRHQTVFVESPLAR